MSPHKEPKVLPISQPEKQLQTLSVLTSEDTECLLFFQVLSWPLTPLELNSNKLVKLLRQQVEQQAQIIALLQAQAQTFEAQTQTLEAQVQTIEGQAQTIINLQTKVNNLERF